MTQRTGAPAVSPVWPAFLARGSRRRAAPARMRALISSSDRRSISVTTSVGLDFVAATSTRGRPATASRSPASRAAPVATASSSGGAQVRGGHVRGAHDDLPDADGRAYRQQSAGQLARAAGPKPPSASGGAPGDPGAGPLRHQLAHHPRRTAAVGPGALPPARTARPSDAAVSAASTSRSCTTSMWSLTNPTGARPPTAPAHPVSSPAPPGGRSRPVPARARSAGRCGSGRRGPRAGSHHASVPR